jgi:hypothetical protein
MMIGPSLFILARNMTSFWLTNRDKTSAASARARGPSIHRLLGPPIMTYIPLGFKTRLHADSEWFPTQQ